MTMNDIYLRTAGLFHPQEAGVRTAVGKFNARYNRHNYPGMRMSSIGEFEVLSGMFGKHMRLRDSDTDEVDAGKFGFGDELDAATASRVAKGSVSFTTSSGNLMPDESMHYFSDSLLTWFQPLNRG